MARSRARRVLGKVGVGCGLLLALAAVALFATSFGKGVRDAWGSGAIQAAVAKHEDKTYESTGTDQNLASLFTGLKLYQESEGRYPDAARWMDELSPRLILNNLPKAEAEKKLVRPGVPAGEWGYAINGAAAGKYLGDLPKGTVLVFESASTARNAHGDPKRDAMPHARAVTIEGALIGI